MKIGEHYFNRIDGDDICVRTLPFYLLNHNNERFVLERFYAIPCNPLTMKIEISRRIFPSVPTYLPSVTYVRTLDRHEKNNFIAME